MNYETAVKLKNAGYPQKKGVDASELRKTGLAPVYICEHSVNHYECESSVYIPTLSELLEACGEDFGWLRNIHNSWEAEGDFAGKKIKCSTPEEAVGMLWLELNKK